MQVHEEPAGVFVIARNFRTVQSTATPEFGSGSARRRVYEVWSKRKQWVARPAEARTFPSFADAQEFLEAHRVELEVS